MALEHELHLLGILKYSPVAYDAIRVTANDFSDPRCAALFAAIQTLIERGMRPTDDLILEELKTAGSTVGLDQVVKLKEYPPTNVEHYANEIKRVSKMRRLKSLSLELADAVCGRDPDTVLELIEQRLTELSEGDIHDIKKLRDLIAPTLEKIETAMNEGESRGILSGYGLLDHVTRGFFPGTLNIIGARPSIGKTSLALSMAGNMIDKGIVVGFFSCEMSGEDITERLISAESRLCLENIRSGRLNRDSFDRMNNACSKLYQVNMLIDDTPNIMLTDLRCKARAMRRRGVQIIFIDYLTLIRHPDIRIPRAERVGDISKSLKQLARELHIPIVLLSQLNRDAEKNIPTLDTLRQSGEVEEDADLIMLMHRERAGEDQTTTINVVKQRNGPTDKVEIIFLPSYVRFENKAGG